MSFYRKYVGNFGWGHKREYKDMKKITSIWVKAYRTALFCNLRPIFLALFYGPHLTVLVFVEIKTQCAVLLPARPAKQEWLADAVKD